MMAQKTPPEQTDFLATALECELLSVVSKDNTLTAEKLINSFFGERSAAAQNALEGCLAKHFVRQDETGNIFLTEEGKQQI